MRIKPAIKPVLVYLNLLYMTFNFKGLLSSLVPLTSLVLVNDISCDTFVTVVLDEDELP